MRTWTENSELSQPSRRASCIAAIAIVAAVGCAGWAARPAQAAAKTPSVHGQCVAVVTHYEYAPELCDGSVAEQQWITTGFDMYGTTELNGNALDGIVTAVMAAQGLDLDGQRLTAVSMVKPS